MKTLFITHHYLHGKSGGCYASSAYINAFAEISEHLTLLFPMKEGMNPEYISKKIEAIPVWYKKNIYLKLIDLLCGKVHRYNNISHYIKNKQFDLIVFDTSIVSYRLIDLFHEKGSKVICIHHNFQYEYFQDNVKGILKFPILYWCKRYERDAVRKSDLNLTLTNQDANLLSQYGEGKEIFRKLGVFEYKNKEDTPEKKIKLINEKNRTVFIITGGLGDYQTEHSLLLWLNEYYPILINIYPIHKLLIAGRNPSSSLYEACKKHTQIEIIPNPNNMNEILEQGNVFICPTSLGGGLKLRIMDGLSYGMPILTHAISARGYDEFEKAGFLFSYDSIISFSKALMQLKKANINYIQIKEYYNTLYSFEFGVKKISEYCHSLLMLK